MRRIISYDELPSSQGESIYLRMETDPKLYFSLLSKGYRIVNHIRDVEDDTIYVTGRRQDTEANSTEDYKKKFETRLESLLGEHNITKPQTYKFSYQDLINHKYRIPFVLKNEFQNGGREKFLIATEEDYEHVIEACKFLLERKHKLFSPFQREDQRNRVDYSKYLDLGFTVQEYIHTPSEFNTSMRVVTSASNDLIYAMMKYNKPGKLIDDTTLLGYLLREVYPLSTKSIVSNTLSGGSNILLGEDNYRSSERTLLNSHKVNSKQFQELLNASQNVHEQCRKELGIICAFDYIYDQEKDKWFLLEYHSRPMLGEFSKMQGLPYQTPQDRITADGRVRATALSLALKKTR